LTSSEKAQIDLTIGRCLQTNRRVETRLIELGMNDATVLEALNW
jgi:hypothetical protein